MRKFGLLKFSVLIASIILLLGIALLMHGGTRRSATSIGWNQSFDFGVARLTDTVEHTFILENPTPYEIQIDKIVPSCSCTIIESVQQSVPPGGSVSIPVRVSFSGPSDRFATTVAIFSGQSQSTLSLKGRVFEECPQRINFGRFSAQGRHRKTFLVNLDRTADVVRVDYDDRMLRVDRLAASLTGDRRIIEYAVEVTPAVSFGDFQSEIKLYTSHHKGHSHKVSVEGYKLRHVEAKQNILALGPIGSLELPQTYYAEVIAPYGDELDVRSADVPPDLPLECDLDGVIKSDSGVQIPFKLLQRPKDDVISGVIKVTVHAADREWNVLWNVYIVP